MKKKSGCQYIFTIKSAREEMAFSQLAVTYQHFLRAELRKRRVFNYLNIVKQTLLFLQKQSSNSKIIPLNFTKK